MSNRTDKNEIIVASIDDPRLKAGMKRVQSGSDQQFGGTTHKPEFTLTPPEKHLYALEVNGIWMWVNGCAKCNQNKEKMSYVVCEEHDRCQGCNVKRHDVAPIPNGGVWGSRDSNGMWGFQCHSCHESEQAAIRSEAQARIPVPEDFDEWDFKMEDEAKCPWCSAALCTDESYDADGEEDTCDECGNSFTLTANHSVTWTTKRKAVTNEQ